MSDKRKTVLLLMMLLFSLGLLFFVQTNTGDAFIEQLR
jgi:hypothetical protein